MQQLTTKVHVIKPNSLNNEKKSLRREKILRQKTRLTKNMLGKKNMIFINSIIYLTIKKQMWEFWNKL